MAQAVRKGRKRIGSALRKLKTPEPARDKMSAEEKQELERKAQGTTIKVLGFALLLGIVAKLLGRSFVAGFFGGGILYIILVSLNVMSF